MKEDSNFVRDKKPQKCLFWRWEEYNNPENKGKVVVQIRNITKQEWEGIIDDYLWMVAKIKKLGIITTKHYGDIILNPKFENKVYSRGVFVTKVQKNIGYGYNMDLVLDRDRNCISDINDFEYKARNIIFFILKNYLNYKKQLQMEEIDFTEIEMFDKFPEQLLKLMDHFTFLGQTRIYLSQNTVDFLWKLNVQIRREKDKRFNVDKMELAPQPLYNVGWFTSFIREKKLSDDFYSYFEWKEPLYSALSCSSYYIDYNKKFEECYQAKKVITPPENKIEKVIKNIISKIQLFNSSFDSNCLVFKELETEETYYKLDNKYYFSSLLFDKPEKNEEFIFGKCMEMQNYRIMDLLKYFKLIRK